MAKASIPGDLDMAAKVDVTGLGSEQGALADVTGISDAIRTAREWNGVTYLTEHGRPVAAIVGVDGS